MSGVGKSWEYVCDRNDCELHVPIPLGQAGEWVEIEVRGARRTLTWVVVNGHAVCPRHTREVTVSR